ncbi:unnamed protein product [Schistosoma turkestanicum]|nr:unnamed protein product [Schistosoma turkestanicum]
MDHSSNKGNCVTTELSKRISQARKASEISDSTILYNKEKYRSTSLPMNDLLTSSFLQAFRAHHISIYPDLNQIIELAVSDIQEKRETMDNMEKSFISLNLHDFIGHKTCRAFYEKSDGIILIFDIWSNDTLRELEEYHYSSINNQNSIMHKPIYMVLGNKKDLIQTQSNPSVSKVSNKRITDFVNALDGMFFEISAKSGENVQEAIDAFLRKLKLTSEKTKQSKEIKEDKKMGCCSCCFL